MAAIFWRIDPRRQDAGLEVLDHSTKMRLIILISLLGAGYLRADDWPQWRGPERNGISAESGWLAGWPEGGAPRVAWRAQVGKGHSAISVVGQRAYTAGWDGEKDTVFCLDAATGAVKWKQSYPSGTIVQWSGPRATPTISDGVGYTLGQHGQLRAWDAEKGTPRWSLDLPKSYEPDVDYGFSWSPLIVGDLLILGTGSKGLAVRIKDGRSRGAEMGKRVRVFRPCHSRSMECAAWRSFPWTRRAISSARWVWRLPPGASCGGSDLGKRSGALPAAIS